MVRKRALLAGLGLLAGGALLVDRYADTGPGRPDEPLVEESPRIKQKPLVGYDSSDDHMITPYLVAPSCPNGRTKMTVENTSDETRDIRSKVTAFDKDMNVIHTEHFLSLGIEPGEKQKFDPDVDVYDDDVALIVADRV